MIGEGMVLFLLEMVILWIVVWFLYYDCQSLLVLYLSLSFLFIEVYSNSHFHLFSIITHLIPVLVYQSSKLFAHSNFEIPEMLSHVRQMFLCRCMCAVRHT